MDDKPKNYMDVLRARVERVKQENIELIMGERIGVIDTLWHLWGLLSESESPRDKLQVQRALQEHGQSPLEYEGWAPIRKARYLAEHLAIPALNAEVDRAKLLKVMRLGFSYGAMPESRVLGASDEELLDLVKEE